MLIRFWCDSDITFSCGLHKNLMTALYFSIINVLCGAGGDASFAPQANLVLCLFLLAYFAFFQTQDIFVKISQQLKKKWEEDSQNSFLMRPLQ